MDDVEGIRLLVCRLDDVSDWDVTAEFVDHFVHRVYSHSRKVRKKERKFKESRKFTPSTPRGSPQAVGQSVTKSL